MDPLRSATQTAFGEKNQEKSNTQNSNIYLLYRFYATPNPATILRETDNYKRPPPDTNQLIEHPPIPPLYTVYWCTVNYKPGEKS